MLTPLDIPDEDPPDDLPPELASEVPEDVSTARAGDEEDSVPRLGEEPRVLTPLL
jgi:hypothetical protein